MVAYLLRRLLLVVPTLLGIIALNFAVVQFAPGGPVEQVLAELKGRGADATARRTRATSCFRLLRRSLRWPPSPSATCPRTRCAPTRTVSV